MISSEGDSEGQSTTAIPLYSIVNVPAMNEVKLDESIQLAASQGGLQWHGNPEALTTISDNQAAVIMDTQQQAVLTASNPQLQYVSLQQGLSGLQCTPTMQSQNNNCQNVGLGTVTHVVNPQKLEQTTVLSQHPQPQQQQNVVSQTTNASKMVANTGSAISSQKAEDKTKLNMFLEKEKQMKELLFPAKSNMSVSFPRADREPVPETVTANIINPSMPGRFIVTTPSAISYMLSPKNSNTNSPSLTPTLQAAFNAPILTQPLDVVSSKAPPMGDPVVMHLPGPSLTAVPSDVVAHVQPTGATSVLPSPAVSITNPRSVVNQPTRCDVSNALTNSKKHNSVTVVKSQRKISTPKKSKPSHGKDKGGASTSKTQSEDANSPSPNRQMKPKENPSSDNLATPSSSASAVAPPKKHTHSNNLLQDVLNEKILELLQSTDVQQCLSQQQSYVRQSRQRKAEIESEEKYTEQKSAVSADTSVSDGGAPTGDSLGSDSEIVELPAVASRTTSIWSREASAFSSVMRSRSTDS